MAGQALQNCYTVSSLKGFVKSCTVLLKVVKLETAMNCHHANFSLFQSVVFNLWAMVVLCFVFYRRLTKYDVVDHLQKIKLYIELIYSSVKMLASYVYILSTSITATRIQQ